MIVKNILICPDCKGDLKYYDKTKRLVRTKRRKTKYIKIKRFRCIKCGKIHRELPEFVFPYKQYEREIISGVVNGYISPHTLGYEDYPCEITMVRWSRNLQPTLFLQQ